MAKRQSSLQDFFSKKRLVESEEKEESESNIDDSSEGSHPDLSLVS